MTDFPEREDLPVGASASASGEAAAHHLAEHIASHAIFVLDPDGAITTWPAPAQTLYGYDSATVLDEHVNTLLADRDGTAAGDSAVAFLADARDESVEVEHWHERADGSVFWGTLSLSPLWSDQFQGYVAVCQDTTVRKEYEQMLERQNDRLKEFTDILAHDLRNPLSVIDANLTLYEKTGDDKHVERIVETTDRMTRLVDDLLRVARQGNVVEDPEPTDIGAVVDTAWSGIGRHSPASVHYEEVRSVSADSDRLRELFENLFRNSVEHGGDSVSIRVGPLDRGFYVEDDGPGIPEERRDTVFDHGFSTDDEGSGYGLSIVRTIASAHGWDIRVTDGDSGGVRFEVIGIEFLD